MASSPPASAAPSWDLTAYFASVADPAFLTFRDRLAADVRTARQSAAELAGLDAANLTAWESVVLAFEDMETRTSHLGSYLGCLGAAHADDDAVAAEEARLAITGADLSKLRTELLRGLRDCTDAAFAALIARPALDGVAHALRRARTQSRYQMPSAEEGLAADLAVDGLHAWGRLYNTLSGRMSFELQAPDGSRHTVPMSRRRALMADPDRRMREAAFRDGQLPWQQHADTLAAALNGIAGARLTLQKRRGISHYLETPLFDAAIDRATLDALMAAIRDRIEVPRRALRIQARLQGTPGLAYFDLEAPQVPAPDAAPIDWPAATRTVSTAFDAAYPALGSYFREMLRDRWIEAEARPGKRPGAFCTSSGLIRQERVFMTHADTIHDVVTIAHEVGHAWHARVLRDARAMATMYPMTLAETASNFGEMILLDGLLGDPALSPAAKAHLLDQEILRAGAYLLNIPMRFLFETRFHDERAAGEVSRSRLSDLMVGAQEEIYGDTLMPGSADPLFWASKVHFFITEVSFYNFPYVFGYLLGTALFARFRTEGPAFLPRYEDFLRATGAMDCEDLARVTLGVDLRDPAFWASAIDALSPRIDEYESLLRGLGRL